MKNKYYIIIFLIILWIYYQKSEYFNDKKIITIYSPTSYFGIGDYIRGIIHLYQNEPSSQIYIDYSTNDISKYLYNDYGNNMDHSTNIKPKITNEKNYKRYINSNKSYLFHNAAITYPIDKKILLKIKKMFMMKPDFKIFFDRKMKENQLHNKKFAVLHIRCDDKVFTNDRMMDVEKLDLYIENNIIPKWKNKIIVLSNSNLIKEYFCTKYNFKKYEIIPVHTGAIGKLSSNDIKDTLLEFFTITKSTQIYQYCENRKQVSGFSKRISEIYDIPIEII